MDILEKIVDPEETWEDILVDIRTLAIDNTKDIDEYAGKREQREGQVGKRPNKKTKSGKTVIPNKVAIPFNLDIVRNAVSFLFGNPVELSAEEDISEIKTAWNRLRLDQKFMQICEHAKAYRQGAILFKIETKGSERWETATVLDPTSSELIPVFDDFGAMEAFLYEIRTEGDDDKETVISYLYTADKLYILEKNEDESEIVEKDVVDHKFGRIPIVYIEEEKVEYEDVKPLIDRFENRYSRFCDTNDYHGSPNYKAKGDVDALPDKDDNEGTVWELPVVETDHGNLVEADVSLLTWDSAPEATKMELELGKGMLYDLSATPDLSFDNVKGIGNISGIAMELMFLKSILKAKFSEVIYLVAVKRALNLLQLAMGKKELNEDITVTFSSILPDHIQEKVEMLSSAVGGKPIMSQETAVGLNPHVKDEEEEMKRINQEANGGLGDTED